jgi:hypothetical protein
VAEVIAGFEELGPTAALELGVAAGTSEVALALGVAVEAGTKGEESGSRVLLVLLGGVRPEGEVGEVGGVGCKELRRLTGR